MRTNTLPTAEYLAECFDLVGGSLRWKRRPASHFSSIRSWSMWNSKWSGKTAGRKMVGLEYRQVGIAGVRYLEHRVIARMCGLDTSEYIDHKNRSAHDNRPENLRQASQMQNMMNNGGWQKKDLRVGVFAVGEKFTASIRVSGRQKHLGTFSLYDDAVAARVAAERDIFGEFAVSLTCAKD